jgi:hypothetical protein
MGKLAGARIPRRRSGIGVCTVDPDTHHKWEPFVREFLFGALNVRIQSLLTELELLGVSVLLVAMCDPVPGFGSWWMYPRKNSAVLKSSRLPSMYASRIEPEHIG